MSNGRPSWAVLLAFTALLGPFVTPSLAQNVGPSHNGPSVQPLPSGRDLFLRSCANCHGPDGTGAAATQVGLPIPPPDFTDSRFASREPKADWAGIVTLGGPVRGFDRLMPAFGDALTREEIDLILDYVQTLYEDKNWPRGEFNLPLALGTEKAFPEDEVVLKNTISTEDAGAVDHKLIYEKRFGSRTQIELVVPFGWHELSDDLGPTGEWVGGMGDVAIGLKRVLFHNLGMGSIVSFTFETILPTGDETDGWGKGFTVFEPFVTWGQFLPLGAFLQVQTGVELPTNRDEAENEGLFRVAMGKTFNAGGEWGRAFSPMVEFLGAKELEGGTAVWDIMPELHFTLNQRQHVMANVGVRFPLTETEGRNPQFMFLLLWDWFDGGLFEGW
ncbi:MAG: c-type cytochrome [Longimicrobiales bacterium]